MLEWGSGYFKSAVSLNIEKDFSLPLEMTPK
jgi:hypothetical protein